MLFGLFSQVFGVKGSIFWGQNSKKYTYTLLFCMLGLSFKGAPQVKMEKSWKFVGLLIVVNSIFVILLTSLLKQIQFNVVSICLSFVHGDNSMQHHLTGVVF